MTAAAGKALSEMTETLATVHELQVRQRGSALMVTCSCLLHRGRGPGHTRREAIECRPVFPAADAVAAWRAWHEDRGMIT